MIYRTTIQAIGEREELRPPDAELPWRFCEVAAVGVEGMRDRLAELARLIGSAIDNDRGLAAQLDDPGSL